MKLSLSEVATVLGKSERQVRYLVQKGEIPSAKVGGRWRVESGDLPVGTRQREELAGRLEETREAVERAFAPFAKVASPPAQESKSKATTKEHFSVTQMVAFEVARRLVLECRAAFPASEAPASRLLFSVLAHLCRGCHAFHREQKARSFSLARDAASTALDVLDHLALASHGFGKGEQLRDADSRLCLLRTQLELAFELGILQEDLYLALIEQAGVVGRQVGGWLRSVSRKG